MDYEVYDRGAQLYESLESDRQSLEGMWRDCAALTLPYVFPEESNSDNTQMMSPFNSVGPSSVNTLASKLLVALLPPSGSFFRLLPNEEDVKGLSPEEMERLDQELSKIEHNVIERINQQALRVPLFEALKLLVITGNALLYKVPDGSLKVFSPYNYVVQRDFVGEVLNIVIQEIMDVRTLPKDIHELVETKYGSDDVEDTRKNKNEVIVYTVIEREDSGSFKAWQEVEGMKVPDSETTYKKDKLPYIVLRWTTVNNEDYGRGLVEQYLGDFRSLEGLTQTIVEGGGIAAKHIFGLRPSSAIKVDDLNNARNGDFVLGDLERDVTTLQVNKSADLQVPFQLLGQIENRLLRAFLSVAGNIRDSERTTAVEVRATIAELEATLGGVFSVLASDFQTPLVRLELNEISPDSLKVSTPSITTGVNAISRERDFNNLNTIAQSIGQFGPEAIDRYLKIDGYFRQIATALNVDPDSIVKTPDEVKADDERKQAEQVALAQATSPQQGVPQ